MLSFIILVLFKKYNKVSFVSFIKKYAKNIYIGFPQVKLKVKNNINKKFNKLCRYMYFIINIPGFATYFYVFIL